MQSISVSEDIVPVGEFKAQIARHLKRFEGHRLLPIDDLSSGDR